MDRNGTYALDEGFGPGAGNDFTALSGFLVGVGHDCSLGSDQFIDGPGGFFRPHGEDIADIQSYSRIWCLSI